MTGGSSTDIDAKAFFLADHAVVESGKVYANGAFWDRLNFTTFPGTRTFAVVAVLHVPRDAYHQNHGFAVWFEDTDRNPIHGRLEGQFSVGASPEMKVGGPTTMPLAAVINNFVLHQPGCYACVLEVDGSEVARWRFQAVQVFESSGPAPSGPMAIPPLRPDGIS